MGKFTKIYRLIIAVNIALCCVWFALQFWSTAAHTKGLKMQALQHQADELSNKVELRLYNKVAAMRWVGRFELDAVYRHRKTCTPSFMNIQEYTICMENLLGRLRLIRIAILCIVSLAGGVVATCLLLLRRSLNQVQRDNTPPSQIRDDELIDEENKGDEEEDSDDDEEDISTEEEDKEDKDYEEDDSDEEEEDTWTEETEKKDKDYEEDDSDDEDNDTWTEETEKIDKAYEEDDHDDEDERIVIKDEIKKDEYVEDDAEFVCSRVFILTQHQLHNLGTGHLLGVGGYGSARHLLYDGSEAVVKELLEDKLVSLFKEARVLLELNGAAGVPRLLAVCLSPPALVQEFVGHTYDEFLRKCSVEGFVKSLITISERLEEIHAKDIVHNDLKMNNITFTGTVCEPVFHIIDFGLACRIGQVLIKDKKEGRKAKANANLAIQTMNNDFWSNSDDDVIYENKDDDFTYDKNEEDSEELAWIAPEVMGGRQVFSSGDVYSFGFLVDHLLIGNEQTFLTAPLRKISDLCTVWESMRRPPLTKVTHVIVLLHQKLTPEQRSQTFMFVE